MMLRRLLLTTAGSAALSLPHPAAAFDAPPAELDELVVTADPLGRDADQVASSVAVMAGDELTQRRQSTLGETLNGLPGVSSDTFGGGASRPVIRGQTAPRVKALSDGGSLMDASEVSPDHAISAEPLLLEAIEILRGPSALLYGGGAIGGAVNLLDLKVPRRLPAEGYEGAVEIRGGTADDEAAGVAGLTAGAGPLAFRIEGARRRTSDYAVPDWSETRLDGSYNRSWTAAGGVSWIGERGYLGAAYTEQRSTYGLPGHTHEYEDCHPHGTHLHCGGHDDHDHDDHEGHGPPLIELRSRRFDLRGELAQPFTGVERLRFRGGYTDYAHDEVDDGEVGTTFSNRGHELRLEAQHVTLGALRGVVGVQTSFTDFAAIGEESFIPKSRTRNTAIFLLEEYVAGPWRLEGALRQEWQEVRAENRPETDHRPLSASAAATLTFAPGFSASLSLSRSQRAPAAQELHADGVHLATNTYEIGDPGLDVETARAIELTVRKTEGATTFSVSAYRYAYEGYVYARTLDQFGDFRLIRYSQDDAAFTGVEGELVHALRPWLSAAVFGDHVRGKLADGGGNLPRIPAGRLGARLDLSGDNWSGDLEYARVFDQEKIADFETATPGHHMLNASLAYDLPLGGAKGQVFVRGTNLLDELALNHASLLSRLAPLRGRNVVVGLRANF
ncbi:MAG: TonB-dependent receptor domain-containing protein [Phenylobacterium sp.]|uniref:TonB-dependent receptor domain-containing protein n=1 Tax=Phenylobacterium sp. TaxID=1871053 RepID=UPI00391B8D66